MRRRFSTQTSDDGIQLLPLMNIIMLLIPFMILGMQLVRVGVLSVSSPKMCSTCGFRSVHPPAPPLNLTMVLSHKGLALQIRSHFVGIGCRFKDQMGHEKMLLKKQGKHYPFGQLRSCLQRIKARYPHERRIIILAEPQIRYATLIQAMDTSRKTSKQKRLFPVVVFSAGVL